MKKVIISTTAVCAGLLVATAMFSCKKVNCTTLASNASTAATAYSTALSTQAADTKTKCEAYKAAMQKFLDESKCTGSDAATKAAYTSAIAATTCN
jgi:hypothetical protein